MNEIYLKMATEDAVEASRGQSIIRHEVSPSAFLQVGLELEEQQYVPFIL
jgi:hypothetical protein